MKMPTAGRAIAYVGVLVGLGVSITINVMHARRDSDEWWAPWLDGGWPFMLFVALEVLTRISWGSRGAKYAAWVGVGMVALVAGVESYWNLRSMMITAHKEAWLATLGPLGIDGLMTVCAAALMAHDEPTHDEEQGAVESPHKSPTSLAGPVQEPAQEPAHDRPIEPTHPESPQVEPVRAIMAPVSQDAVDRVLAAVASGQPMGKAAIMAATGLSRSTAGRALTHLVAVGRLSTIGRATQPDYTLAQQATHEPAVEASR